jgi:hypothetical protein
VEGLEKGLEKLHHFCVLRFHSVEPKNWSGRGENFEGKLVGSELLEEGHWALSKVRKRKKANKFSGRGGSPRQED